MARCGGEWPAGERRGWEQGSAVRRRAIDVLARYVHHDRVGVVCHGGIIRHLTGRSADECEIVEYDHGLDPAADGP
jgi:broad specificity phosphatase PhoE